METDYVATDNKNSFRGDSDKQESSLATPERPSLSVITNGGPSSLLTMQLNAKPANLTQVDPAILNWNVDDVVDFVSSIDICKEYSEVGACSNIFYTIQQYSNIISSIMYCNIYLST